MGYSRRSGVVMMVVVVEVVAMSSFLFRKNQESDTRERYS